MKFSFADISGAVLNTASQDLVKGAPAKPVSVDTDQPESSSDMQKFSENLSQQMDKAGEQKKEAPAPSNDEPKAAPKSESKTEPGTEVKDEPGADPKAVSESKPATEDDEMAETVSKLLEEESGIGFLNELKQLLLKLSDGDLDSLSIDEDGLDALKKLLVMAGFNEADVTELVDGLKEKLETEELVLGDFMDQLFDLPLETADSTAAAQEEVLLDTSSLPILESMMTSLGLDQDQINEILAQASRGESGISLDVVIEKLQAVETNSVSTGVQFQTTPEGADALKQQMAQLGLVLPDNAGTSQVTLTDLVSALDKLRQDMAGQATAGQGAAAAANVAATEKPVDLFDALFKGLTQTTQKQTADAAGFSFEEVKEQFKNEFMVQAQQGDAKGAKPSSLLNAMTAADAKDGNVPKDLAALMSKQGDAPTEMKSMAKEAEAVISQVKGEAVKAGDDNVISLASLKQGSALNGNGVNKEAGLLKNLPTHVTHQVSKGIVRAVNQGENTLRIQLNPPELGRLLMTIDNNGNSMKVSIITENQAAKEVLAANVNELKTVLSGSGISLDQFDVDMNSDFRQSMADARGQAGQFNQKNRNKSGQLSDNSNTNTVDDPIQSPNGPDMDGSYHFVA